MAEQNEDFVSFEKALRDLKMQSEQLKKLVSEGEIRAFRDGQSMKFKREDVESLAARGSEGEEIVFEDALEDDTGMVTEELSDEETLLGEDDLLDEEPAPRRKAAAAAPRARPARIEIEEPTREPGWVTVAAGIGALVALYGFMIAYSIATEAPPGGLTGFFASK